MSGRCDHTQTHSVFCQSESSHDVEATSNGGWIAHERTSGRRGRALLPHHPHSSQTLRAESAAAAPAGSAYHHARPSVLEQPHAPVHAGQTSPHSPSRSSQKLQCESAAASRSSCRIDLPSGPDLPLRQQMSPTRHLLLLWIHHQPTRKGDRFDHPRLHIITSNLSK